MYLASTTVTTPASVNSLRRGEMHLGLEDAIEWCLVLLEYRLEPGKLADIAIRGSANALLSSALSMSITGRGVRAGARTAYHALGAATCSGGSGPGDLERTLPLLRAGAVF